MKKTFFAFILLLSSTQISRAMEVVNCTDHSGIWKVFFTLDGAFVSNLQFTYFNQLVARYPIMKAMVNHVGGRTYYDINFNSMYYFDFERTNGSKFLNGAFFIPQDPSGFETSITCDAF